ncbi:MAG: hypothetical protein K2Y42_07705 [Hyphomicrobium sp.]|jgi:hypothetical protein|uniref:hypothetical protein n=1 Tax=Hyphomicrobium sp. TaxID=82 RepID=UPI0025C1FE8E|nr:hypothetical protein [Hyphomicrobium sp.]MBX9862624.1 hypothetical protein [Hyphomicrobium sp.]
MAIAAWLATAACAATGYAEGKIPRAGSTIELAQVIKVSPTDPAPAAAAPPTDPECLTITQSSETTYMISNTACADQSILTSIELATGDDQARCFTKKIRSQISIASESAPPVINYQCIEGSPGCSADVLRSMFPECRAG